MKWGGAVTILERWPEKVLPIRWHLNKRPEEGEGAGIEDICGKSVPGRGGSKFKGFAIGVKETAERPAWLEQSEQVGGEVRDVSRGQITWRLVDHYKDVGFYSEWNVQPLTGFEEKSDIANSCFNGITLAAELE